LFAELLRFVRRTTAQKEKPPIFRWLFVFLELTGCRGVCRAVLKGRADGAFGHSGHECRLRQRDWKTSSAGENRHVSPSRFGIFPRKRIPHLGDRSCRNN